jgi:hypothetical protein
VLRTHGGDHKSPEYRANQVDDINLKHGGTGASYLAARLERDRPDLAARVEHGELSAHAAAIEAGFRERTITVPLDPVRAEAGQPEGESSAVRFLLIT